MSHALDAFLVGRKKTRGRPLNGILLLDKPIGISSNRALQRVAKLFGARKAGHTGSLDPLASGMLPICFGEATKISGFLLDSDKAYTVTAKLGEVSDTGDADGEIIQYRDCTNVGASSIENVLSDFLGRIEQIPPMYSALKHRGQPLYKLARAGKEIERKPRRIEIKKLQLLDVTEDTFSLHVECSKGTYIRSLIGDIGEKLGCGAHVTALRRDWVAPFQQTTMLALSAIEAQCERNSLALDKALQTIESALDFPRIELDTTREARLRSGQTVDTPEADKPGTLYVLLNTQQDFVGIGVCKSPAVLASRRLVSAEAAGC